MMIERRQFLSGAALVASSPAMAAGAAVVRPWRVAATNQRMPTAFFPIKAGVTGFKYRTLHIVGAPVTELVFGFCGWAVPANIEVNVPVPHSYDKVAIEIGDAVVPVTFGGGRRVTIMGGMPFVLSDPVRATAFGRVNFARDTRFYVRALGSVAAAGRSLPAGTIAAGFGMRMVSFPVSAAIDDIDVAGALQVAAGATGRTFAPGPCLILGRIPAGFLAAVCAGDSIGDGSGDGSRLITGKGFFNRAAVDANDLNAIGSLNLTKHGSTAGTPTAGLGVAGAPGFAYRQAMLGFGNVLVDEYGTNTLGSGGAAGGAERVLAASRPLWTLARGAGVQRVLRTALLPRTRSSNRFVDAAGQTPVPGWEAGGERDAANAAFAAARVAGEVDRVVDLLTPVSEVGDRNRWLSNGVAAYATNDGVHPSAAATRLMTPALRSAYAGLVVV